MKNSHYKSINARKSFYDYNDALRYLRGKDQKIINEDDPEFFSLTLEGVDNLPFAGYGKWRRPKSPYSDVSEWAEYPDSSIQDKRSKN